MTSIVAIFDIILNTEQQYINESGVKQGSILTPRVDDKNVSHLLLT